MTPSEKRHFSLTYSGSDLKDSNVYLRLFKCLEKMQDYDEKKMISSVWPKSKTLQVHVYKNYLYKLILKNLRQYHELDKIEIQLRNQLNEAEILSTKGLYKQALKWLERSEKTALQFELFLFLVDIYHLRNEIEYASGLSERTFNDLVTEKKKRNKWILTLANEDHQKSILGIIAFQLRQKGSSLDKNDFELIEKLIEESKFSNSKNAESFGSKLSVLKIQGSYFNIKNNQEKAHEIHEEIIKLMEKFPLQIQRKPEQYLYALNNAVISALHLKRFNVAQFYIKKIYQIQKKYASQADVSWQVKCFSLLSQLETEYVYSSNDFTQFSSIEKAIEEQLKQFKDFIHPVFVSILSFNLANLNFKNENYIKCKKWIGKFNLEHTKSLRNDVLKSVSILELMMAYQNKEDMYFDSISLRIKRKNKNEGKGIELLLIDFLKKFDKLNSNHEKNQLKKYFASQLTEKINQEESKYLIENIDLLNWVEQLK